MNRVISDGDGWTRVNQKGRSHIVEIYIPDIFSRSLMRWSLVVKDLPSVDLLYDDCT